VVLSGKSGGLKTEARRYLRKSFQDKSASEKIKEILLRLGWQVKGITVLLCMQHARAMLACCQQFDTEKMYIYMLDSHNYNDAAPVRPLFVSRTLQILDQQTLFKQGTNPSSVKEAWDDTISGYLLKKP
jgi:hypothetical protein